MCVCMCMCVCVCVFVSTRLLDRLSMKKTVGYFFVVVVFPQFPFFSEISLTLKKLTLILWN